MTQSEIARRGLMLVLSSPSGAGKTTLSQKLLSSDSAVVMSISVTTRPPRPKEVDGRDYQFVSEDQFDSLVQQGALLEHATVFGHRYGTPKQAVNLALEKGHDVLFDIDWQGTQQLDESARDDLVKVFVLPPSWSDLEVRLRARAQDSDGVVKTRMSKAVDEMSHWAEYDYVIVNRDIEHALSQIVSILSAERLKRKRQIGLSEFVKGLSPSK
jgi:guanylate kinase